jgi:hypothetical protein
MQQFGGIDSKRHFTVVMGDKEHGLYVSSTPSSAAKKAVTKLCAKNKSKKVEFSMREITQGSKKKTYGPYLGYIEKLKDPIELKGRVIKHKSVVKLQKKKGGRFFSVSEFNKNATGQLTSNAKNKMLENFKKIYTNPSYLKERRFDTDTFYFGAKNLIDYNRNKYFPFSICNIVHNKEDLVSMVFNPKTQKSEKKVDNMVLKLRILIFDPQKNKKLLQELEKITQFSQQYSQQYPGLSQIITEHYSVIYEQDELFIFLEFNLLYYYQIIQWIIYFGENLLIDPNKYFKQCIKLIIDILTNLRGLEDFHKLFWNYKYRTAMELCLLEIFNQSFYFEQKMLQLPGQIKYIIQQQREQREQEQLEQQQQQLYQQQQKEKEFISKVTSLCKEGYKPVEYSLSRINKNCALQSKPEDKCCLMQSRTDDKCIGCEKITLGETIENSVRQVFNETTNRLGQAAQALTPRLTTPRQLTKLGDSVVHTAQNIASTTTRAIQAPTNSLRKNFYAVGNLISSKMQQSKGQYPDHFGPSPHSWSNKFWKQPTPIGQGSR